MRIIASLLVLAGILVAAGGAYVFTGLATAALGAWLFDKAPAFDEALLVVCVLVLGGAGAVAVILGLATAPP